METKDAIITLRKNLHLSQEQFAKQLSVTRQAVSRWENGDTMPNIDTLKLMAKVFAVPVDDLLGHPAGQCQSCGMMLEQDNDKGTEDDGRKSEEYCTFCYQQGKFTQEVTLEEMMEYNLKDLDEWNKSIGMQLTEQEARAALRKFLPTLKRWRKNSAAKA